jgi:hypothetical protein
MARTLGWGSVGTLGAPMGASVDERVDELQWQSEERRRELREIAAELPAGRRCADIDRGSSGGVLRTFALSPTRSRRGRVRTGRSTNSPAFVDRRCAGKFQ